MIGFRLCGTVRVSTYYWHHFTLEILLNLFLYNPLVDLMGIIKLFNNLFTFYMYFIVICLNVDVRIYRYICSTTNYMFLFYLLSYTWMLTKLGIVVGPKEEISGHKVKDKRKSIIVRFQVTRSRVNKSPLLSAQYVLTPFAV